MFRTFLLSLLLYGQATGGEPAFLAGYKAYLAKDYQKALSLFEAVEEDSALHGYALYFKSRSLLEMGRYREARAGFETLLSKYPEGPWKDEAILGIGESLLLEGRYKEAKSLLGEALGEGAEGRRLLLLGEALEGLGDMEGAFRTYLLLWRDRPAEDVEVEEVLRRFERYGYRATLEDRLERIENLSKAMRVVPHKGRLKMRALEELKAIPEREVDDETLYRIGRLSYRLGDMERAERVLRGLLGRMGDDVRYLLAMACLRRGKERCAREGLKALVDSPPYATKALYHLALLEKGRGRIERAVSILEEAYRQDEEGVLKDRVLWSLAWFNYLLDRYSEAKRYLSLLKRIPAMRERATYWLGRIAILQGERKGVWLLQRLAGGEPSYYSFMAGRLLRKIGEFVPVRPQWDGTLPLPAGASLLERGRVLLRLGLYELAVKDLEWAIEKAGNAELVLEGAYLLQRAGEYYKAITVVTSLLDDTDGPIRPYLLRLAYPQGYKEIVTEESRALGLDPLLIYAIIREESHFNPGVISVSQATGLMQIIPSTGRYLARKLGYERFETITLLDPVENIRLGTNYVKILLDTFEGNLFYTIAAYNGGPGNVKRWLETRRSFDMDEFVEDIPFDETRRYVKKVIGSLYTYTLLYGREYGNRR